MGKRESITPSWVMILLSKASFESKRKFSLPNIETNRFVNKRRLKMRLFLFINNLVCRKGVKESEKRYAPLV